MTEVVYNLDTFWVTATQLHVFAVKYWQMHLYVSQELLFRNLYFYVVTRRS